MAKRTRLPQIINNEAAAAESLAQLRGLGVEVIRHVISGNISAGAGVIRYSPAVNSEIVSTRVRIGTAPVGSSAIFDVHKNGTTIFTSQAARPTVAAAANISTGGTPAVTELLTTDYITIDVDQVGSGTAGANATVEILVRPARPANR